MKWMIWKYPQFRKPPHNHYVGFDIPYILSPFGFCRKACVERVIRRLSVGLDHVLDARALKAQSLIGGDWNILYFSIYWE